MTTPIRLCAGCRAKAPRADLVRLVKDGQGLVHVDVAKTMPGRGVNLHSGCLDRALKTRAITRGLRLNVSLTRDSIVGWPDGGTSV